MEQAEGLLAAQWSALAGGVQGFPPAARLEKHHWCNPTQAGHGTDTAVFFPCLWSHPKLCSQCVPLLCILLKHEPLLQSLQNRLWS